MTLTLGWRWFGEHWPMSLTMLFGSFVAGSTPAGGASVAFPVFTKALAIESHAAATFGLMIQSVGMTMASIFIYARRIPVYGRIVCWGAAGGCVGVLIGLLFLRVPPPYPKLLFSCLVLTFGVTLWMVRRPEGQVPGVSMTSSDRGRFLLAGFVGGMLASQTGSGADMLVFMVMMVGYHLDGKRSIPTSVCIMAIVSIVGFVGLLAMPHREIGEVWHFWAVCVPVVAVGAPLGAYVISRVRSGVVFAVVMLLIAVEVVSTLLLVPLTAGLWTFVGVRLVLAGWVQWRLHCLRRADSL